MNSTITTPWGYKFDYEGLTYEKGKALIKGFEGDCLVEYQQFSNVELSHDPYLLSNGKVVVISYISASVYQSMKDYYCMRYCSDPNQNTKQILKDGPFQKIEYLPDGEKIFYTRLRKIYGETLRHVLPSFDSERYFFASKEGRKLFLTADSEVLEYRPIYEDFNLFKDETDYQKYHDKRAFTTNINRVNPNPFIVFQMVGRNPYGEAFIEKVDELATMLPKLLNVNEPERIFNFKFKTLEKIEKIIYRNTITDTFSDQILLPLFAYYGKTFIKENSKYDYDIKWVLRQDELFGNWVPDIQLNGHYLGIYDTILKMLDPTEDHRVSFRNILTKY